MKITDLKVSYLEVPLAEPIKTATAKELNWLTREKISFSLVKIFTDEGIVGVGAQDVHFSEWGKFIERTMKPILVNQIVEPFYIEKLARMLRAQSPNGVSPRPNLIEMALWDAVGKKAGLPIYKILGAYQNKVRAMASVLEPYPLWGAEEWTKFFAKLLDDGFKGMKLHIGYDWPNPNDVIDVVKAIRKNLGYDFDIMVDVVKAWRETPFYNLRTAIKFAKGLEKYDIAWLEEPLPHFNNPDLCAQLCKATTTPIAGGGGMYGIHTFKTVLEKGALDIVEPAVMRTGLSEVRRIALLAELYGRECVPQFNGIGIGMAATLHVIGSTNISWLEYPYHPPALTPEARDCMISEPIKIDKDGFVKVPDKPGLGIELDEGIINKYTQK